MLRTKLQELCRKHGIFGSILLAEEGINGTIAGQEKDIEIVVNFIRKSICPDLQCKYATSEFIPFRKLKVLLKKEIVTLGMPHIDPSLKTGIQVDPTSWDALISDPEVLVIDTRNTYEVEMGSFKGSINPRIETFGEFPQYVKENLDRNQHKKIAMFCTGGIRCEKASSYLLEQGFETVYQLEGGILKYLNQKNVNQESVNQVNVNQVDVKQIEAKDCLWEGKCFVFDERIAVG